jgi:hypothetical protein
MIILRTSTKVAYLLHNGKLVLLHPTAWQAHKAPVLHVDDTSWANLVTAYGSPVGT